MSKTLKDLVRDWIYDYVYSPGFFKIVYFRDWRKIRKIYGEFDKLNRQEIKKYNFSYRRDAGDCGGLLAEIVKSVEKLDKKPKSILLDGDTKLVSKQFQKRFDFLNSEILTVGIGDKFDYDWNFENNVPEGLVNKKFDLIISQAMFEHLIDPYKHLKDLITLLNNDGYLIIHTEMPGYNYHRYPVDTVRFFPDWFEEAAERFSLKIVMKFRRDFHVVYVFKK